MIGSFILKNQTTSKEVLFGQDINCDYLLPEGGVDWGSVPAQHNTFCYPGQIGTYISSTTIKERDVIITGYAFYVPDSYEVSGMSWEQKNTYCYKKILNKKKELSNIINPNDYVRIIIGDYFIEGKPQNSITFGKTESENNNYFCSFMIDLYCNNPMFKRKSMTETRLSGVTGKFHFPLIIPIESGVVFGDIISYRLIAVENDGPISIGCIIKLKSKGTVVNPLIQDVFTGEKIKINKTLLDGEEIIINTNDGEEKGIVGIVNHEESNYFTYWDFSNDWIKIRNGVTVIGYSVESENENLLEVSININPMKYDLEEM